MLQLPPAILQQLLEQMQGSGSMNGGAQPAAYRQFTPGPMPEVPFMPPAQVGPQRIALGLPQPPPATASPPMSGGPFQPRPFGLGGMWNQHSPTSFGRPAAGTPQIHPAAFGSSYQNPMQLAQQKQMNPGMFRQMNPQLMNLGLGMMQGGNIGQMLPQIMQAFKGPR